jgi:hypothetical protein
MRNPAQNSEMKNVRIINSGPIIKELSSGESTTLEIPNSEKIMMPSSGHMPYTEADVTIDYSYKDLLSLGHNKSIRFQAVLGADAVVHWFHKAINE